MADFPITSKTHDRNYGALSTDKSNDSAIENSVSETTHRRSWLLGVVVLSTIGCVLLTMKLQQQHVDIDEATVLESSSVSDNTGGHNNIVKRKLRFPAADAFATTKTTGLLTALEELREEPRFLFGHQNDNKIGQYFIDKEGTAGKSDIVNATGAYPGVFGYDWMDVLNNGYNFSEHVRNAYKAGGIIVFDWLADNPATTDGAFNDLSSTPCAKVLKMSGSAYDRWTGWLDIIAENIRHFAHDDGEPIPFIFRLLHETTGRWYWWSIAENTDGEDVCADADFIGLWNFTQQYLIKTHDLHNIIWLYSPSKPTSRYESAFEQRYPGDDSVDMIGFDQYSSVNWYNDSILTDCYTVANFSLEHDKLACIAETGIEDGIQDVGYDHKNWFYKDFAKKFMHDRICSSIVYALTWENAHPDFYWTPLDGDATLPGLKMMYESDFSVFADDSKFRKVLAKYGYNEL